MCCPDWTELPEGEIFTAGSCVVHSIVKVSRQHLDLLLERKTMTKDYFHELLLIMDPAAVSTFAVSAPSRSPTPHR